MKWFLIVMVINNANDPVFFAHKMTDKASCFEASEASKILLSDTSKHGNAIAIYCSEEPASKSFWKFGGNLFVAETRRAGR